VVNLLKNVILLREVCYCEFLNNALRTKSVLKVKVFAFIIDMKITDRKIQKMSFHSNNKSLDVLNSLSFFLHKVHSDEPDVVISKSNKVL